jgi:hypothetical protein
MLAVITCCDEIGVAEYQVRGHRRVIAPDGGRPVPGGEKGRFNDRHD